jgi:Protein of unknown function (DUF3667)
MPDGLETAGDLMTGAVLSRAVEPGAGEGRRLGHGACLNCGIELLGAHCHGCGQKAKVHRTLKSYGHDLLHGVFHFEGKVWKTLPMLVFKPGELTRRYIHGERAKFVSPLALFLFAVFLMFAVVGGLAGEMKAPEIGGDVKIDVTSAKADLTEAELNVEAEKRTIDAKIAAARKAGRDTAALEKQAADIRDFQSGMAISKKIKATPAGAAIQGIKTSSSRLNAAIAKANKNPNLLIYKLQSSAYKYSWALIPLSVPFVWLLFFWRRQFKVYDHAVFVTYSLTFMLLIVVVATVLGYFGAPEDTLGIAAGIAAPLHMYRQVRGTYGTSRLGAFARTIVLAFFGLVVLIVFLVLLLALGIMG